MFDEVRSRNVPHRSEE